jgi:hypothetical protein
MRKLYFFTAFVLLTTASSVWAQQNLILGGTMEVADTVHWKVSSLANDPTSITSYQFGYTLDRPAKGEGGCLHIVATNANKNGSHIMFYQPVKLMGGKTYRYDFAIKAIQPMINSWLEVYVGNTEPADGADYGSGQTALGGFKSSNWASQCNDLFEGTLREDGCLAGSKTDFTVSGEGEKTLYIGFKAGIWAYATTIEFVVDNVSLVEVVGNTSFSSFLSEKIKIYPNPADNTINISYSQPYHKIRILNVLGREVFQSYVFDRPIDTSELKPGVYVVELSNQGNVVAKNRFIKK